RRTFGAANQAEPLPARLKERGDARGKAGTCLVGIEDVEAAAVEYEVERRAWRIMDEEVENGEVTPRTGGLLFTRRLDRQRRNVDGDHVESALRQPQRVGPRATADLESASRRDDALLDGRDQ